MRCLITIRYGILRMKAYVLRTEYHAHERRKVHHVLSIHYVIKLYTMCSYTASGMLKPTNQGESSARF